jgi:hypothetical protein
MTVRFGVLLPGYLTVGTGINAPVRGVVETPQGRETAICKHLSERALPIELLCALLGRSL